MQASVPILLAREKLNDPAGDDPRWSNASLLGHLASGQAELYRLRPDCVIFDGVIRTEAPDAIDTTAEPETITLGVADTFKEALAYFVASRALNDGTEHANNPALAEKFLQEFGRLIS